MCRKYRIIFLLVFALASNFVKAQDTLNTILVEQKSYELYLKKDRNALIAFGNKSIDKGFDYFYLRMRMGIAFYEQGKYRQAEKHFAAAYAFNSGDNTVKEYLYYCYLYSERYEDARMLSRTFDKELAIRLHTDSMPSVSCVTFEYGQKMADSSRLFHNATYCQVGLQHYIKNSISFFHAATYFSQTQLVGDVSQFQYYLKSAVPLKSGWLFSPAIHFVHSRFSPVAPSVSEIPAPLLLNFYMGSFLLTKRNSFVDVGMGTTVSSQDSIVKTIQYVVVQYIHNLSVCYYPFGNNRLLIGGNAIVHTNNNYRSMHTAWNPYVSVWVLKPFNLTASYFVNTGNNIIEANGYLVNNSDDFTASKWNVIGSVTLTKHMDIYGLYQLENKTEVKGDFKYQYNIFVAGIKIKL